jgi:hypothetical protein
MVTTFQEFKKRWDGIHNFLMGGECTPFSFTLPPLVDVIQTLRNDNETRFLVSSGDVNNHSREPAPQQWHMMPVDELLEQPFSIGHFGIEKWDVPGGFLEGFGDSVVRPLREAFEAQGFRFSDWFKPYIFASGPNCCSTYHMDFSHVLAWQKYGVKHFYSLRDPDRFAPTELRRSYLGMPQADRPHRPENLSANDIVDNVMPEGAVLWNAYLTPHWVCGESTASLSINISFRGLTLDGELCPREAEVQRWREEASAHAR